MAPDFDDDWKTLRGNRFPIEKLQAVDHIVTHKDCADGLASAMILHDVLPRARITFLQYNSPEQKKLPAEPGMLFCDFSPDKNRVQEFVEVGALCLDHHKFAKGIVEAFTGNGVFADEVEQPGVCGAVLAYRHVWLPLQEADSPSPGLGTQRPTWSSQRAVEGFATLAGIRDTWQKQNPRWREACEQAEAIKFWPLEDLLSASHMTWDGLMQPVGRILFQKNLDYAKLLAETSYRFTTPEGTRVVIFGGISMSSDTAEAVGEEADIVVGFGYKCDEGLPVVIYSTRSHTTYDVGAFCAAQGGGGHTKAAGFSVKLTDLANTPNPYEHFRQILNGYETWKKNPSLRPNQTGED